jgi:hypothetical protein
LVVPPEDGDHPPQGGQKGIGREGFTLVGQTARPHRAEQAAQLLRQRPAGNPHVRHSKQLKEASTYPAAGSPVLRVTRTGLDAASRSSSTSQNGPVLLCGRVSAKFASDTNQWTCKTDLRH